MSTVVRLFCAHGLFLALPGFLSDRMEVP
jgi:hypothetical protein